MPVLHNVCRVLNKCAKNRADSQRITRECGFAFGMTARSGFVSRTDFKPDSYLAVTGSRQIGIWLKIGTG